MPYEYWARSTNLLGLYRDIKIDRNTLWKKSSKPIKIDNDCLPAATTTVVSRSSAVSTSSRDNHSPTWNWGIIIDRQSYSIPSDCNNDTPLLINQSLATSGLSLANDKHTGFEIDWQSTQRSLDSVYEATMRHKVAWLPNLQSSIFLESARPKKTIKSPRDIRAFTFCRKRFHYCCRNW